MHINRALWRAINSFIHPMSMAAVVLLLFNDHWLRWHYPSWLTGKMGDFTWLVFAPFIAAVFFSWVIPRRLKRHEQIVGVLSFAAIGLWFALAKTVTPVHELTVNAWEAIIGWQGTQRMDATDLLTLPALFIGWWIFWRADNRPLSFRPIAPVLFALGIMATLASDGPIYQYTDSGVTSICQMGSQLVIATETDPLLEFKEPLNPEEYSDPDSPSSYNITPQYKIFTSEDGGLSWTYTVEPVKDFQASNCSNAKNEIISDPSNEANG